MGHTGRGVSVNLFWTSSVLLPRQKQRLFQRIRALLLEIRCTDAPAIQDTKVEVTHKG